MRCKSNKFIAHTLGVCGITMSVCGCHFSGCNNPYPQKDSTEPILYSSFSERPKHLDPIRAYVANEYAIIGQICQPPLQYHYLKRPYELIPLTATRVPKPVYWDKQGNRLPANTPASDVAFSTYDIQIKRNVRYQPHPAFARDAQGKLRYHHLTRAQIAEIGQLYDLQQMGTRELTADDYVYQIKRMSHPKLHCPIAGLMSEHIVGLREYAKTLSAALQTEQQKNGNEAAFIDLRHYPHPGVQVIDRYTYRVKLKGKYPQFVYWLAMPFFTPMPWEADKFHAQPGMEERNLTLDWYPIGTGPFMLVENNPNRRMVLKRNPNFAGEPYPSEGAPNTDPRLLRDAGKLMPFIDRAVYSLETENIPYWNKFLQGYYDTSGISSDSFDQAIRFTGQGDVVLSEPLRKKKIELTTAIQTSIWFWAFNMSDSAIGGTDEAGRKLRRALSIAIDQEEFISIFFNGRGVVAQGPIPPGIFGYHSGKAGMNPYTHRWDNGAAKRRSIEEAKQLLAEAGYPNGRAVKSGKPLVLYFDTTATGPSDKARLDWIRKQFAKLNIQLIIRATDFNRFQEKVRKGNWQILMWGWNADYPDPENFLFLMYGPNGQVAHGGENHANYKNEAYDRLFEQMKNMDNTPQRQAIIDKMVDILRRDAPWIWGFYPQAFVLHHQWYHNATPNLMANNTLKYKRIDPELRARKRAEWNRPVLWPLALLGLLLLAGLIPAFVAYRRRESRSAKR